MISTRKKKQSNRRLLSQLDDFDRDIIIGNAANERQQNVVDEGTVDEEYESYNTGSNLTTNENLVKVQTLERCLNDKMEGNEGNE